MISYFEEPDEAGLRAELLAPEPLLLLAELFDVPVFPVIAFCAFAADADFVSPDLLPSDLLAIGVFAASLAPAVFFGAADLEVDPALAVPEDAGFDEPLDLPADAEPELFAEVEPPLLPAADFVAEPEFFAEPADFFAVLPEPLDEPDEELVLFDEVDPDVGAPAFEVDDLVPTFDEEPVDFAPPTVSITDAAAPLTAPAAAPASTSPIASFVLS